MDSKTLVNRRTRRTTLTLEADVADYLTEQLSKNRGLQEKRLVNDLLRKGIEADRSQKLEPFDIRPFETKLAPGMTIEKLEEMIREI